MTSKLYSSVSIYLHKEIIVFVTYSPGNVKTGQSIDIERLNDALKNDELLDHRILTNSGWVFDSLDQEVVNSFEFLMKVQPIENYKEEFRKAYPEYFV